MLNSILIADNDPSHSVKLETFLSNWGYIVTFALSDAMALEILEKQKFTVILLGSSMNNGNSLDLYKQIRNLPNGDSAYIIFLGHRVQMDEILNGLSIGINDYLLKPVEAIDLKARVSVGKRIAKLEAELSEKVSQLESFNNRMKGDLEEAEKIQRSLLPRETSDVPHIDFSWHFSPCDEIGGDMLNIFRLDGGHLGLYVLDVCGHGIPAAMLSMSVTNDLLPRAGRGGVLKQYLPGIGGHKIISPSEAARALNMEYQIHDTTSQYFTILFGIIEVNDLVFRYVRAGHPPPIVVSKGGKPKMFDKDDAMPMGLFPDSKYSEQQIQLKPKDRLYILSDGVNEAVNKDNEQYGLERVMEKLSQAYKDATLEESINALTDDIQQWQLEQSDDISIIGIEITGKPKKK